MRDLRGRDTSYRRFVLDFGEAVLNFTWFAERERGCFYFMRGFQRGLWVLYGGIAADVPTLRLCIWNDGDKYRDAQAHRRATAGAGPT